LYTTCCLPSGECGILTELECSDQGGLDRGNFDNISGFCSEQVDCSVTIGCCEAGAFTGCINAVPAACNAMGPNFTQMGPTCNDPPFCIGACCTGGGCSQVTPMECPDPPAEYNGNLVGCSNVCQNTPGACCLESGACIRKAEYGCFLEDGVFQGRLTDCSNTTCPLPPTPTPPPDPVEPQDRTPYIIGISVAAGIVLLCGCVALFCCFRNRRRKRYVKPSPY